jgi:hypothetical protein
MIRRHAGTAENLVKNRQPLHHLVAFFYLLLAWINLKIMLDFNPLCQCFRWQHPLSLSLFIYFVRLCGLCLGDSGSKQQLNSELAMPIQS